MMNRNNLKNLKYAVVLILLFPFGYEAKAQQTPMYTQYMHNTLLVNPAYAGSTDMLSAAFLMREQWVGFDGAPKTRAFSLSAPVTQYDIGAGFTFVNDELGPVKQNSFYADFAYHLKVSQSGMLAMGLQGGIDMIEVNLMELTLGGENDGSFSENYDDSMLNFGLGFYYYTDRFYMGASVPRMLKSSFDNDGVNSTSEGANERYYFITAGVVFDLNKNLKFKPTMLTRIVENAPMSVDVSANFILNERLGLGVSYRIDDAVGFLAHYQITNQLRVGYAYDLNSSDVQQSNDGTHEIMVAFDYDIRKKKKKKNDEDEKNLNYL